MTSRHVRYLLEVGVLKEIPVLQVLHVVLPDPLHIGNTATPSQQASRSLLTLLVGHTTDCLFWACLPLEKGSGSAPIQLQLLNMDSKCTPTLSLGVLACQSALFVKCILKIIIIWVAPWNSVTSQTPNTLMRVCRQTKALTSASSLESSKLYVRGLYSLGTRL